MDYDGNTWGRVWGCLAFVVVIALVYLIGVFGLQ
jgi:hypothetical protein